MEKVKLFALLVISASALLFNGCKDDEDEGVDENIQNKTTTIERSWTDLKKEFPWLGNFPDVMVHCQNVTTNVSDTFENVRIEVSGGDQTAMISEFEKRLAELGFTSEKAPYGKMVGGVFYNVDISIVGSGVALSFYKNK